MIGTLFRNRYRLDQELGKGGMGIVYRAHDTLLQRDVAVKILSNSSIGTEGRARMLREAQAAARLNHPNIVSVYDAGEESGTSFIIMELLDGDSLYERRPQALEDVIQVTGQICNALEHAHTHGIIHRDLKPENVIVTKSGVAKLTDFGLARSASSRITVEGAIIGTIFYMSPEQAMGEEIDGRTDLYSLGVMLYELTTGRLPFRADDPVAVISQHLYAPVVPPCTYVTDLPPALNALILKLLNKRPEERLPSAAAVREALAPEALSASPLAPASSGLDTLVRGRLVGRDREFGQVKNLWRSAMVGAAEYPVLLISGESGIGKTPLVREIKTLADISGGEVLSADCYPGGTAPYAPIAETLRQALALPGTDLPDLVLADLTTLAPELRTRYPQLVLNQPADHFANQQRLFESVISLFTILTTLSPVLLVIEDVQWADGETLYLLRHLARRARTARHRLLIVLTYRETEIDSGCCLTDVLLDFNREHLAQRIKLSRFDRQQTRQMLEIMFQEPVATDFLEAIYHETEGNHFYIEEICKALVEQGKLYRQAGHWCFSNLDDIQLPQSVRLTIQSRLSKLSSQAQDVLRLAAIIGREFNYNTLRLACDIDEDTLIDAIESAVNAQLIREVKPDRISQGNNQQDTFAFEHGLIAMSLQDGISGLRRARLHRRVAEALEKLTPEDYDALAYHFAQAKEIDCAHHYYQKAGERALEVFANREAERSFRSAHELADNDLDRAAHLSGLGEALFRQSRYQESIQAWLDAIAIYQPAANHDEVARQYARAARAAWYAAAPHRGLELCVTGMANVPEGLETPGVAALMHETARAHFFNSQHTEALALCQKALDMSKRLGLVEVQAETLATMGLLPNQPPELKKQHLTEAVTLAESSGLVAAASRAHLNLGGRLFEMGEFASARAHFMQAYENARKIGNVSWMHDNLLTACEVSLEMGDLPAVEDALGMARQLSVAISNTGQDDFFERKIGATLLRMQGHLQQAAQYIESQSPEILPGESWKPGALHVLMAEIMVEQAQYSQAAELLEKIVSLSGPPENGEQITPLFILIVAYTRLAKLSMAKNLSPRLHTAFASTIEIGDLLTRWGQGHIAQAEKRWDPAFNAFRTVISSSVNSGRRWHQARATMDLALAYQERGDVEDLDQVRRLLHNALDIFTQIKANGYVEIVQERLSQIAQ